MLRSTYNLVLRLSGHRHAVWYLALISFLESSVFPLPPDILLIPLILANRQRAFWLATVCTVSSVLGGYLGYAIGYFLFQGIGLRIFEFYGIVDSYLAFKAEFDQYGSAIIILKGLTPIPYKLVTIASGAAQFNLLEFTGASIICRGLRFYLVALLLWKYGQPIREFIEKRLVLVTTVTAVLIVGGFVVLKFIPHG
ncbi:MAG: DedA family protein [Pseudomonadota bacterium]|nr:DedA family protein [Pseudomonadota bacterium]